MWTDNKLAVAESLRYSNRVLFELERYSNWRGTELERYSNREALLFRNDLQVELNFLDLDTGKSDDQEFGSSQFRQGNERIVETEICLKKTALNLVAHAIPVVASQLHFSVHAKPRTMIDHGQDKHAKF